MYKFYAKTASFGCLSLAFVGCFSPVATVGSLSVGTSGISRTSASRAANSSLMASSSSLVNTPPNNSSIC